MKIWRKDSTKPVKNDNKQKEEEFTDISQASTPIQNNNKKDKMEEIYSTKDKQVKYKRLTPLEAEAELKRKEAAKEKLASGKAEIALNTPKVQEKIVELTCEPEEGTVIAEDIIEDVEQFSPARAVHLQDIDDIDIDIDPNTAIKKYERQVNSTERYEQRNKEQAENEYERVFGKPKFYAPSDRIVTKIPTYQHDSKVEHIHLKAGRFTDVVESEYDEYLKSNDPVISKRPQLAHKNIEPKQSLLYTLSHLATQKNADKEHTDNTALQSDVQEPKKPENKIKKFFRILLLLILPKKNSAATRNKANNVIDYQSRQDAKHVSKEINRNLKNLTIKVIILAVLFVISLVFTIMERTMGDNIFSGTAYSPIIYCGINLVILLITGIISKPFIISGIKPLKAFKGNSDTAASCAYIACLIQQIASMFFANQFVGNAMHLYTTIVTLGFTLGTLGRIVIVSRVKGNFKFITSKSPAYAAKVFNDEDTARKMLSGTTASHSVVVYQHETDFLSDFLKISYAPDPSEELSGKLAPITLVSSVFVSIVYGVIFKTVIGALSALAVMCCISIPICTLLAGNIPLKLLCKKSLQKNAMISGYPSVRQFCDCDAFMVKATELYPKGSINLNAIKNFVEFRIEDSHLAAAMILKDANSPLQYIFDDLVKENTNNLPRVESVMYEDKLGLVGWVNGERVLIGNRKLLDRYNVYIEDAADETKYAKMGKQITYIACSGQLVSMLVCTYSPDSKVKEALQRTQTNGLCIIVSTTDPNVTQDKISSDYEIFYRTIKILSTGFAGTCNEVTSRKEETSRAYLATRGNLTSLMYATTGCVSLKNNLTIGLIIQIFGLILGVLLCATMVLYASVSILGVIEMLLYMLFWGIATIAAQLIKKP